MTEKEKKREKTIILDQKELMYSLYSKQSGMLPQPFLECIEGPDQGRSFILTADKQLIGRGKNCHIQLTCPRASAKHALVFFQGESFMIEDLNSSNGTYVNDRRVTLMPLANNDLIRIGYCILKVKLSQ